MIYTKKDLKLVTDIMALSAHFHNEGSIALMCNDEQANIDLLISVENMIQMSAVPYVKIVAVPNDEGNFLVTFERRQANESMPEV